MTAVASPFESARRIAIRLPTWLGDGVMATPALRSIRAGFPNAEVMVCGRGPLMKLLDGFDPSMQLVSLAGGEGRSAKNIKILRELEADLAVILPHSFRSAWEIFRARIPCRVGYARDGRGWFLTHSISPHRQRRKIIPVPMVQQYLELTTLLGAPWDSDGPRLPIDAELRRRGRADLERLGVRPGERLVGLSPGASFGPSKIWPVDRYAAVADECVRRFGAQVLLLCGPGEEDLVREVERLMDEPAICTADAVLPLDTLKVALESCDVLITSDAGPRHVSVAVGTPVVVLMGPTDPRYSVAHPEISRVLRHDVPCGPCHEKICPLDHKCMRLIEPTEVIAALGDLLDWS